MELMTYFRLFRKWFWLLFLGAFLAGGAAFLRASRVPDTFQSSVTLSVGSSLYMPNPQYSEMITGSQLAQTYVVMARSYNVAQAAVEAGNFPISAGGLRGSLNTSVIPDTALIVLTVTYTDPVLAADMANEVARQLILLQPSSLTAQEQDQLDLAATEIVKLNEALNEARVEFDDIDRQIAITTDPVQLEQLQEKRNTIIDQINQTLQNIGIFQNTITTLEQRTNRLEIFEQARPGGAIGVNLFSQTILGAMVGFALGAGLALLIEYLDDTISDPSEATQILGVPALAGITRFGKSRDSYAQRLITYHDPGSHAAEEYRTLRTNLLFSTNGSSGKNVFVVTSPGPSEGKSVTAANLAVTMAMAGWRVLLIDADLRRPKLHEIFQLDNNVGLSTLLSVSPSDLADSPDDRRALLRNLEECIQETDIPGLQVLTSGHIPLNPTEVLGSASMQRWFQEFNSREDIDIVLFDTPPALVVADSAVLASAINAPVILVIESKATRRAAAVTVKERLDHLDVQITGVVLNSLNPRDRGGYGYGYGYYYYYYSDSSSKSGSQN